MKKVIPECPRREYANYEAEKLIYKCIHCSRSATQSVATNYYGTTLFPPFRNALTTGSIPFRQFHGYALRSGKKDQFSVMEFHDLVPELYALGC